MPEIEWHPLNTVQYESTNVGIFSKGPSKTRGLRWTQAVWLGLVIADYGANNHTTKSLCFRGYYIFSSKCSTRCVLYVFFLVLIATLILRFELNCSLKCFLFPPLMAAVPHKYPTEGSIKDYFVSSLMAKTEWFKTLHIKTNAIFVRNLSALVSVHARIKSARSNLRSSCVDYSHSRLEHRQARQCSTRHCTKYTECRQPIIWRVSSWPRMKTGTNYCTASKKVQRKIGNDGFHSQWENLSLYRAPVLTYKY